MELCRRCRTRPRHRCQRTKGGFRTERDAEQALATVIRTVGEGTYVARDPQTLEQWITRWLVTMAPKVRSSTLRDYANGLGRVSDRLGQMPLQGLRPLDIEEMYASLLEEGHRYGGGLAPQTVRNLHIALAGRWRTHTDLVSCRAMLLPS